MNAALVAALGAFFTGLGSLLSALWAMRSQKKKSDDECADRIETAYRRWRQAIREGLALEKRKEDDEGDRWSHLP